MNLTLIKLAFVIVTAPFWMPFVKALWEEFNEALKEDGGLLGGTPTLADQERIRDEQARKEDPMVHEPLVRAGDRREKGFPKAGAQTSSGSGRLQRNRPAPPRRDPRRPSFR